jgi:two-component system, cell cycle sensor histidine kinase and response regulator CckA
VLAEDVTEPKRLEAQLRQALKMEAVGRLAGGVAHQFNNLLTVITGHSELLLDHLDRANPLRPDAEEIRKAAERAAEVTAQLLAFGRKVLTAPRALDLNALLRDAEPMLRHLVGEGIDLSLRLDPDLGWAQADPGQIHQVLLNLALNARDAMAQGGRLTVSTVNVQLDEEYARRNLEVQPGAYVRLSVTDTGCGISEKVRAHLFEPFFTTKESGESTGLGLSTAYGIVKQSGGHIEVESEEGRGATFHVHLPRVEAVPQPEGVRSAPESLHGSETILLVEDEEMVRNLVRYILQQEGYSVLEAVNGVKALELSEAHQGPIHLLVADVIMPQMGGPELARRLWESRPNLPVLFLSGYAGGPLPPNLRAETGGNYLQKPFTPRALSRKVRELLDAPTG